MTHCIGSLLLGPRLGLLLSQVVCLPLMVSNSKASEELEPVRLGPLSREFERVGASALEALLLGSPWPMMTTMANHSCG